jgi:hypothetical protein
MFVCWTQSASARQANGVHYDECDDIHDNYDPQSDVIHTFRSSRYTGIANKLNKGF